MRKSLVPKSRFLSLVLRHEPGTIGIELDRNGWADVDELLAKAAKHGPAISPAELAEIVETNEKRRFDWDRTLNRIRANQGHSVDVDLELAPATPPEELFHGTPVENRGSILATGLLRGNRQHVHLSVDTETARRVGLRHGAPIIFRVAAGEMARRGIAFYHSKNGVWLTEYVSAAYLKELTA